MGGFAKTLAAMVAGGTLAAGGFVAAVALPQVRGVLGGSTAFADISRTPEGYPASPSTDVSLGGDAPTFGDAPAFQTPPAVASTFDSLAGGPPPGDIFAAPPAASIPAASVPAERPVPPTFDSASFGDASEFGAATEFGTTGDFSAPPHQRPTADAASLPSDPAGDWAAHVAGLKQAGVDDFQILPAGVGAVRMIVWLGEGGGGRVARQLQGQGATPTAAAAAALKAVTQYQSSADWLGGAAE